MRSLGLGLAIAALGASAAQALELPPLCAALHRLGDEARRTGEPQRISLAKPRASTPTACVKGGETAAQTGFCDAATGAVGAGFQHLFPWRLYECVRTLAASPRVTTAAEFTGVPKREKMTRLDASLGGGAWMHLAWTPAPDPDPGPNPGYYGRYDLVVWSAKR